MIDALPRVFLMALFVSPMSRSQILINLLINKSTYLAAGIQNFIIDFFRLKYLLLEVLRFFDDRRNFLVQSVENTFLPCKPFNDTLKRTTSISVGASFFKRSLALFKVFMK